MINLTYFGSQMSIQMGATTSRADAGAAACSATITKAINLPSSCSANNINRSQLQSQRQSDNSQPPGASDLQPSAKPESNPCAPGSAVAPASDPSKRMKLSQLDYLANPLRTDHPFGKDLLTITPLPLPLPTTLSSCIGLSCARARRPLLSFEPNTDSLFSYILEIWSPKEMALFHACIC